MKTIKQIADELSVDKQRVYRYIKKNDITEANQKNGVMYYDELAQLLIKQGICEKNKCHESTSNKKQIDMLLKQFKIFEKELDIKNHQIKELNERLAESQQLLNQQQQLNAIVEQKLMELEEKQMDNSIFNDLDDTEPSPERRWYEFWK